MGVKDWFKRKPVTVNTSPSQADRMLAATIARHDMRNVSSGVFTIDNNVWYVGNGFIVSQNAIRVDLSETAMLMLVAHLRTRPEVTRH